MIHEISIDAKYDTVHNDDGISVFDVTEPGNPRYAMIQVTEHDGIEMGEDGGTRLNRYHIRRLQGQYNPERKRLSASLQAGHLRCFANTGQPAAIGCRCSCQRLATWQVPSSKEWQGHR